MGGVEEDGTNKFRLAYPLRSFFLRLSGVAEAGDRGFDKTTLLEKIEVVMG